MVHERAGVFLYINVGFRKNIYGVINMSQFDKYTTTEYVDGLRIFLGLRKDGFLKSHGFLEENAAPKKGRLPRHKNEPVDALNRLVNAKAAGDLKRQTGAAWVSESGSARTIYL